MADGSQVDPGNTSVGVGAAVALNAGISTNVAVVGDDAVVNTRGLTVSAVNVTGQKSESVAKATSGAGAGDVGVAGALAANVAVKPIQAEHPAREIVVAWRAGSNRRAEGRLLADVLKEV